MSFGFYLDAAEWFLEKASRPSVLLIDRFRISVEEMAELAAWFKDFQT